MLGWVRAVCGAVRPRLCCICGDDGVRTFLAFALAICLSRLLAVS